MNGVGGHACTEPDRGRSSSDRPATNRASGKGVNGQAHPLILVVDDDVNTREAVETLLELDGYRVALARDGQEALELLEGGLAPALIVLDMNMPRMDGAAFRQAQRRRPALANIPVIVCSGGLEHEDRLAALGPVVFLRKPMSVDCLQRAVHLQCPL